MRTKLIIPTLHKARPFGIQTRFAAILFQCKRAYGDCNSAGFAFRQLDWRCAHTVSARQFVKLIEECIGVAGYNNFTIETAKRIAAVAPFARYRLAREGSVCVYIKATPAERAALAACDHGADEFGSGRVYGALEPDGTLRLWWD